MTLHLIPRHDTRACTSRCRSCSVCHQCITCMLCPRNHFATPHRVTARVWGEVVFYVATLTVAALIGAWTHGGAR